MFSSWKKKIKAWYRRNHNPPGYCIVDSEMGHLCLLLHGKNLHIYGLDAAMLRRTAWQHRDNLKLYGESNF